MNFLSRTLLLMFLLLLGACVSLPDTGSALSRMLKEQQIRFSEMKKEAESGDADAALRLGLFYLHRPDGGEPDAVLARQWIAMAAQTGQAQAQSLYGWMIGEGIGGKRDVHEAMRWYEKAAQQGEPSAQYNLGACLAQGCAGEKKPAEAFNWLTSAARLGVPDAQYNLAVLYTEGQGGVQKDAYKAVYWYRQAAFNGDREAQYHMGMAYFSGHGIGQDLVESFAWFSQAARNGHAESGEMAAMLKQQFNAQTYRTALEKSRQYWEKQSNAPVVFSPSGLRDGN